DLQKVDLTKMNYPLTLNLILEHVRRIHGDKYVHTLMPTGKIHTYDYTTFCERVDKLANAINNLGLAYGDRVATFASNTYQHLELLYAIPLAGGVIHPINIRLTSKQQAEIVQQADDKLFFVDDAYLDKFSALQEKIRSAMSVHFNTDKTYHQRQSSMEYEGWITRKHKAFNPNIQDENTALALCYTSGTTGEPKGILYSHRSVLLHTFAVNQADVFGITESDVVLPLVPIYHALAWGIPYAAMFVGADIVLHGRGLDVVVDIISETGVTISAGVPTIWRKLLPELLRRKQDVTSLQRIIVGGEAMPSTLIDAYEKELGVEVRQAWGMTEMSPTGTFSTLRREHLHLPDKQKSRIKSMQGRPIPGVQIRLASEDEYDLPWDGETIGEIQVRGIWTAGDYYGTESSQEHFTEDGWLRTGDLATINREGYMHIVDRAKALIKSGGESISTSALEAVLIQHPLVKDATVVGIPDEQWGERPLAAVALSESTDEDISKLLSKHLADEFPKFWIPDHFIVIDEIPKNSVGKTDKDAIMKYITK
ncbi:long-chain fatty acid--CoA ligase, partial [Candidatus Poribacteria bacterium]|nr:long-chain fatty acid--CoA ligase [Candidatus Poribacteria bacterium]